MKVQSLGYVVLETPEPALWDAFATRVLGLMPAESGTPGVSWYRMDERPFRFLVRSGPRNRFVCAGWELRDAASFTAAVERLHGADVSVEIETPQEARSRCAAGLARCKDPAGNTLELYHGRMLDYASFVSPVGVDGFVTGDMGLGHIVLSAPNTIETRDFYTDLLGFELTDYMELALSPDPAHPPMTLHFLHADNPRHHSIALAPLPPNPSGLVHVMVEVKSLDAVGKALDRAGVHGAPISSSLGRHSNDRMVSFYVATPLGFDVEYGYDGWQVDWSGFTPTFSLRDSYWGHHWAQLPIPG